MPCKHARTHPHDDLPTTDATSATAESCHEEVRGGLSCRQHRPAELRRPMTSLSDGSHSSTDWIVTFLMTVNVVFL